MTHGRELRAINVLEIVVVGVVLAIVAALTIPRLGEASTAPPSTQPPLSERVAVLRCAIDRYLQQHLALPAQQTDGPHPAGSPEAFASQLTQFTDAAGVASATRSERFCYGPYLRDGVPACPVGAAAERTRVHVITDGPPAYTATAPEAGWVYNCQTGLIVPNAEGCDGEGRGYDEY
jgi:hypothetical protein